MSQHWEAQDSQTHVNEVELQFQSNGQGANAVVDVPQVRRLTIDDLREELKPILSRSEAANLC
jgi:hypothetical protein